MPCLSLLMELSGVHWYTQVLRGATIKSVKDTARLTSDAFMIACSAADSSRYKNIHSAVVPRQQVRVVT